MSRPFLIALVALTLLILAVGFGLDRWLVRAEFDRTSERFALLGALRRSALVGYFDTVDAELTFWGANEEVRARYQDILAVWSALDATQQAQVRDAFGPGVDRLEENSTYRAVHDRLHEVAREFVEERGYYDFFLIAPDGDVLYTVEKEDDFGRSLADGPYADSGLGQAYRKALATTDSTSTLSDFAPYAPSADAPAMFTARPMLDSDGSVLGIIALQLPSERIQDIMQFTAGMGASGETYLVGEDLLMRSDSRFSEEPTTLLTTVDTETVHLALAGDQGVKVVDDYRGIPVLSAYSNLSFDGFNWAVLAEIDHAEIMDNARESRRVSALGSTIAWVIGALFAWLLRRVDFGGETSTGAPALDDLSG